MSIMTSAFVDAAELMARVQGVPDHQFAVIEHPIASADMAGFDQLDIFNPGVIERQGSGFL
jgi:hypothetical protein